MSILNPLAERLDKVTEAYTRQFSIDCQDAVENLVNSDVNEDIYCFLVLAQSSNFYFTISINAEAIWNKGYGSVDDLDPYDASLMGVRYQNIGYECDTSCEEYEEELRKIAYETHCLEEKYRKAGDEKGKSAAQALYDKTRASLHDIAVAALNNTDFSQVGKTEQFFAMVVVDETDYAEQAALAKRTMPSELVDKFDQLFPELEPREPANIADEIASLPAEEQAQLLVEKIIYHHFELNHYEGSNRFAELLNMETRLIELRPASDPYIARAIDEYGPQVKTFQHGSKEHEEHGYYNKVSQLINALLDMYGHSEAPLTEVLETSLNKHLEWLKSNYPDDFNALSLLPSVALHQWGQEKYSSPV